MFSAEASLLAITKLTWSPDLCAVSWESKGDPDRSPKMGCRAKAARAACVPSTSPACPTTVEQTAGRWDGITFLKEQWKALEMVQAQR